MCWEVSGLTSMSLDGLSKVLAQDEVLRSKLLKDDTLTKSAAGGCAFKS